ncbi:hypothetical protein D3C73_1043560 [compost metagenome]
MLHSHFFATGFIKPLSLTKTCLIKLEDANKIAHHLQTYTCLHWLARQFAYPLNFAILRENSASREKNPEKRKLPTKALLPFILGPNPSEKPWSWKGSECVPSAN